MIRICVSIDVDTDNPEEAYKRVYDTLGKMPKGMDWESTDEWYDSDGEPISEDSMTNARMGVLQAASKGK